MELKFLSYNFIVSSDILFYYRCPLFFIFVDLLVSVCKHFMLFRLGVDASGREFSNVKLFAENFYKYDHLFY